MCTRNGVRGPFVQEAAMLGGFIFKLEFDGISTPRGVRGVGEGISCAFNLRMCSRKYILFASREASQATR